jgi:hypothetical protein
VPDHPLVHRRTAVLGLAATVLVAGCDHGDDIGDPTSSGSPSPATPSPSAPEQTPDEALVDDVNGQLLAALTLLSHARRAPGLAKVLAPLIQAHRRHLVVLEGEPPVAAPPGPPPKPRPSLLAVRRNETQLQAALVDAAGRAESGALAKLLASISASVTQHVAALPRKA